MFLDKILSEIRMKMIRSSFEGPILNNDRNSGGRGVPKSGHSKEGCVSSILRINTKCGQGGRGSLNTIVLQTSLRDGPIWGYLCFLYTLGSAYIFFRYKAFKFYGQFLKPIYGPKRILCISFFSEIWSFRLYGQFQSCPDVDHISRIECMYILMTYVDARDRGCPKMFRR